MMSEISKSYLTVDVASWPIVTLTTAGSPTDDQLRQHLKEIETQVLHQSRDFVQIIDQRKAETLHAGQRAIIAEHQLEMADLYGRYCRGEAYVASETMKGVMIAVFWQAKPPYPYQFFETLQDAEVWARQTLARLR